MSNFELLNSNWFFAFGFAAMFYAIISWFGEKHLSDDYKESLALWLWGDYQSTWLRQFCILFDALFGQKHLSWKCFSISTFFSLLSVVLVYSIFKLRIFPNSSNSNVVFFGMVVLGLIVNTLIDYISLLETRYILQRFEHVSSAIGQIFILLLDVILTSTIFFIFIFAMRMPFSGSFQIVGAIQIISLLEPVSILFYSTFFTSLWSWVFVVSTWFVRLVSTPPVRAIIDVEHKPHRQLTLFGAIIIFVAALLFSFFFKTPKNEIHLLDDWLCSSFPKEMCNSVARANNTALEKYKLWRKGCFAGSGFSCFYLGKDIQKNATNVEQLEDSYYYFEQACNKNLYDGCFYAGVGYQKDLDNKTDFEMGTNYLVKSCESGRLKKAEACWRLANLYKEGNGVTQDSLKASNFYKLSCIPKINGRAKNGIVNACHNLGVMYLSGDGVEKNMDEAFKWLRIACEAGLVESCKLL